tara:strand:+ start:1433 stop:1663 length:231 start_codon:yes stop_codon:yes gene_type:complete
MSKMKDIDRVAEYLHEVCLEQLDDSIDWAIDGTHLDKLEGDDYNQMKKAVMTRTIEYMLNWLEANPSTEIDFDVIK